MQPTLSLHRVAPRRARSAIRRWYTETSPLPKVGPMAECFLAPLSTTASNPSARDSAR